MVPAIDHLEEYDEKDAGEARQHLANFIAAGAAEVAIRPRLCGSACYCLHGIRDWLCFVVPELNFGHGFVYVLVGRRPQLMMMAIHYVFLVLFCKKESGVN